MKKLTIAIMLMLCSFVLISQTTMEEYNYITKGYKIMLESGLDLKEGYEIKDYYTHKVSEFIKVFWAIAYNSK